MGRGVDPVAISGDILEDANLGSFVLPEGSLSMTDDFDAVTTGWFPAVIAMVGGSFEARRALNSSAGLRLPRTLRGRRLSSDSTLARSAEV